jgi:N-acetylmuramoyl-L-alanine amidase CwlA
MFSGLEDLDHFNNSETLEAVKMSDIQTVTGTIKTRYNNDRNPKVNLVMDDGGKYSDYSGDNVPAEAVAGATVTFAMKTNGQYKNVAGKVQVVSASTQAPQAQSQPQGQPQGAPQGVDTRQVMIMRQNAMGHAVQFCNKTHPDGYTVEDAIAEAEKMLAWYQS